MSKNGILSNIGLDYMNYAYSGNNLQQVKEAELEKVLLKYQNYYLRCTQKIKELNKKKITDFIFYVPSSNDYESSECLYFIEFKLMQQHFNTLILNPNQIFISWHD